MKLQLVTIDAETLRNEILKNMNVTSADPRVIMFLDTTISALDSQSIKITDYTKLILGMLVTQLVLYYKACDALIQDNESITSEDKYKRRAQAPIISIMQKANDKIIGLLDKISLSPLEKAKVKKLNQKTDEQEDARELLSALMG